ncbi:MAG: hypothetical protein AAFV53_01285 [Myxococcota bacterium]
MRHIWTLLAVTALSMGVVACGDEEEDEEDEDEDVGGGFGNGWQGTEALEIGLSRASTTVESNLCTLVWVAVGARSTTTCAECEFVYDVDFTFDEDASSGVDGCPNSGEDYSFTYGFNRDFEGDAYLFYEYNGGFFPATAVDYDGTTMTYRYLQGSRRYYAGVYRYITYITYGEAVVR